MTKHQVKKNGKELTPSRYFDAGNPVIEKHELAMDNLMQSRVKKSKQPSQRFFRGPNNTRTPEVFKITGIMNDSDSNSVEASSSLK